MRYLIAVVLLAIGCGKSVQRSTYAVPVVSQSPGQSCSEAMREVVRQYKAKGWLAIQQVNGVWQQVDKTVSAGKVFVYDRADYDGTLAEVVCQGGNASVAKIQGQRGRKQKQQK